MYFVTSLPRTESTDCVRAKTLPIQETKPVKPNRKVTPRFVKDVQRTSVQAIGQMSAEIR